MPDITLTTGLTPSLPGGGRPGYSELMKHLSLDMEASRDLGGYRVSGLAWEADTSLYFAQRDVLAADVVEALNS
eukprot:15433881-Alexandrium_andersonii.AAC.1